MAREDYSNLVKARDKRQRAKNKAKVYRQI